MRKQVNWIMMLCRYGVAYCAFCVVLPVMAGEYASNLVINGGAETLVTGDAGGTHFPGWISDDHVTVIPYGGSGGFPTADAMGSPTRGSYFFYGGNVASAKATQRIDLSFAAGSDIDAGKVTFNLSAWLGGWSSQGDSAAVTVVFYDGQETALGTFTIGPVSAADRASITGFVARSVTDAVPAQARTAQVEMHFIRKEGTANDGYIDDVSLVLTRATADQCAADATLVRYDYLGACGLTKTSNFNLDTSADVSRIRIWYNTNIGGETLNVNLLGPNGFTWSGASVKGGCDPYQQNWCEGNVALNTRLAAGDYALSIDSVSMCANPSGQTTLIVYGCPADSAQPETPPIGQWISGFDITIDANYVDTLLPSPTFTEDYYRVRRSYNPFGNEPSLDFTGATLTAGIGSVRVEHLKINGVEHWVDLTVDVNKKDLPLTITGLAPGAASGSLPQWQGNFSGVDFTLTTADIYGPPTRITLFDVGIEGGLYTIDFLLNPATEFALTNLIQTGYQHYLPSPSAPLLAVGSTLVAPPDNNASGLVFQGPLGIFGWANDNGEQDMLLDYASGSQVQRMVAHNGVLVGTYSPPVSKIAKLLVEQDPTKKPRVLPDWLRSPTLAESLDHCIDEKTNVQAAFKADNQLSQQLVDLVFTVAGHNVLQLSSPTLEKIRTAIASSKDSVLELMANGKVDASTLGVFVSSTVLKNATPEEHQRIIEQVWGNNIPEHAKTAAGTSGSAAENNYKLAAQALADGLASTFFPAFTGAVKTVIQTAKYANDTLADQSFQELYKAYKASNGNWDDVVTLSPLSTNKFAAQKVRNILQSQGKASDDGAISIYLENKMQTLYAQEQQAVKEREKLTRAKEQFLALSSDEQSSLERMLGGKGSHCDLLQKYLDYVASAQLDLSNSLGDCKYLPPTKSDIEQQAYSLARKRLGGGSVTARKDTYQQAKLDWLKTWDCLRYEDVRKNTCSNVAEAGADTPETIKVELGQLSGSFNFEYQTYSVQDRMIVAYENAVLFDSGCVGTEGWKSTTLPYAGTSSQVLVRVEPNCAGTSSTQWQFKASCPATP